MLYASTIISLSFRFHHLTFVSHCQDKTLFFVCCLKYYSSFIVNEFHWLRMDSGVLGVEPYNVIFVLY